MSEPYLATIKMFGGNFAPRGWELCDGQLLAISENQALYSLLGTTYGGDGRTTFALPDLRGRQAVHRDSDLQLGAKGGSTEHTLNDLTLPTHNHPFFAESANGSANGAGSAANRLLGTGTPIYAASAANTNRRLSAEAIEPTGQATPTPVNHQDPHLAVTYIIATQGLFPPRN